MCANSIIYDIIYKEVGKKQLKLDMYLPFKKIYNRSPVFIFIHGGGWKNGNKDIDIKSPVMNIFNGLRYEGFTGISIEYRLTDDITKFPKPITDCRDGVRWVRKNALKYKLNGNKIATWLNSPGGHLSLMVGLTDDNDLKSSKEFIDYSSSVKCTVAWFPETDLSPKTWSGTYYVPNIEYFLGGTIDEIPKIYKKASPISYIKREFSPVLIIHGVLDKITPYSQSSVFYKQAITEGKDVELLTIENAGHGFKNANNIVINPNIDYIINRTINLVRLKLLN